MKKVFFVTGASSGIGAAVTAELLRCGYRVFACARRLELLQALEQRFGEGSDFHYCACDVRKKEDVEAAVEQAISKFGQIDGVFANAGYAAAGRFEELSTEVFDNQFKTNINGVIYSLQACLPSVKERSGILVVMGSVYSYVGEAWKTPYCMSKFAVRALAESLYWELRPAGVHVTFIAPGTVASEIRRVDKHGKLNPKYRETAPRILTMDTEVAARKIVKAIKRRQKVLVLTKHAKLVVFISRYIPIILGPYLSFQAKQGYKKRRE